jgi:hypothetical protein
MFCIIGVAVVVGLIAWWVTPSIQTLRVPSTCSIYGSFYPRQAQFLTASQTAVGALSLFTPPNERAKNKSALIAAFNTSAERVDFGFLIDEQKTSLILNNAESPPLTVPARILTKKARTQLNSISRGYLIVQIEPVSALFDSIKKRRWLGPAVVAAASTANRATLVVGESESPNDCVLTLAFEYRSSEDAVKALQDLMSKQGDYDALGFVAKPGVDRLTQISRMLVIKFEIDATLVNQELGKR